MLVQDAAAIITYLFDAKIIVIVILRCAPWP